jgi:hypothetical protein
MNTKGKSPTVVGLWGLGEAELRFAGSEILRVLDTKGLLARSRFYPVWSKLRKGYLPLLAVPASPHAACSYFLYPLPRITP